MATTNNFCPENCPLDCDDVLAVIPDFGCEQPNDEQITAIYFSTKPLVTGNLTEWNTRLSNSDTAVDVIRYFEGIFANMPHVDPAFKESQRGSRMPQDTSKVLSYVEEDDSDEMHATLKKYECGITGYFWFKSGKHIYGGLGGIYGTLVTVYGIDKESQNMAHNWRVSFSYKSRCSPPRTLAVV